MWTLTLSAGRPVIVIAAVLQRVWTWVGAQTSQASARTSAVAFIGSIAAWARNGPLVDRFEQRARRLVDVAVLAGDHAAGARGVLERRRTAAAC